MSVTVVVPYHSNRPWLDLCVSTLLKTTPSHIDVICVLNNADERAINNIEWRDPRVRTIRVNNNLGYSKAVNLGAREASGQTLVFCDADTAFLDPWFEALYAFHHDRNPGGLSSCKMINPSSGRVIEYGMALTQYNNAHPFKDLPTDHPLVQKSRRAQMACSACMMIDRDLFLDIGGMDEDLHNFYQDTDLCLRLKARGAETWVVADAVVYHQGDSARSNRAPYRADVKGVYYGKNAPYMTVDMDQYFQESLNFLRANTKIDAEYILVDMATVADHIWYQELLQDILPITKCREYFCSVRDQDHIDLLNHLPHDLLTATGPLLYFVDRHIALARNALWRRLREDRGDIVADRNGNLVPLEALP